MAEYINGEEERLYREDIQALLLSTVADVLAIADRHNVDRNNAMEHFATVFKTMQEISTFCEFGGRTNDG